MVIDNPGPPINRELTPEGPRIVSIPTYDNVLGPEETAAANDDQEENTLGAALNPPRARDLPSAPETKETKYAVMEVVIQKAKLPKDDVFRNIDTLRRRIDGILKTPGVAIGRIDIRKRTVILEPTTRALTKEEVEKIRNIS